MNARNNVAMSSGTSAAAHIMDRAERTFQALYEHRPKYLSIHIDGERRASLFLQSSKNQFTMELSRRRPASFIEVFSEQGLCLAYLSLTSLDDGGDYAQEQEFHFSEDRTLRLGVQFKQPRPCLTVSYDDPLQPVLGADPIRSPMPIAIFPLRVDSGESATVEGWLRLKAVLTAPFHSLPGMLTFGTVLLFLLLLPLWNMERPVMAAEAVLNRSDSWQKSQGAAGSQVLHRTFEYYEHSAHDAGSKAKHRRMELWRQEATGKKLRRLFDDSGKLLATSNATLTGPPNLANAWEYAPSADAFRLMPQAGAAVVTAKSNLLLVKSPGAFIEIDAASYRPLRCHMDLGDVVVDMTEVTTESVPVDMSPLAPPSGAVAVRSASKVLANLDLSETVVRKLLHEHNADLGEDIHVNRTAQAVLVNGVISPEERRQELQATLADLPAVIVQLRSPEEASGRTMTKVHRIIDGGEAESFSPALDTWLERQYPNETERSAFVDKTLAASDQAMWHVRALASLQRRYASFDEPTIHSIVADHLRSLQQEVAVIRSSVAILPTSHGGAISDVPLPGTGQGERIIHLTRVSSALNEHLAELLISHQQAKAPPPEQVDTLLLQCRRDLQRLDLLTSTFK